MDNHIINQNWTNRPDDQRFINMNELHEFNLSKRNRSIESGVALDHMLLKPIDGNGMMLSNPTTGEIGDLSNWSFGQLCVRVGAPAGYLRSLPSQLAAIPLQFSMEEKKEDAKLLFRKANGHNPSIDAVTSQTYGRIYDAEMTAAVLKHVDLNTWKIPATSYATKDPKRATTLYASDRDCFICLVNDTNPIEIPGGNGQDTLFRGFICRNSEVGAAAFDLWLFLYRMICDNRIIHGLTGEQHLKIRHSSGGPMRFLQEASPALNRYLTAGTTETVNSILNAQKKEVGKTEAEVTTWLRNRGFAQSTAKAISIKTEEQTGNPRSGWAVVNAITETARDMRFGDERIAMEKQASKILDIVAA